MEYLLVIIFSDGEEYLSSLKIIRGLTKAPVLVVDRQNFVIVHVDKQSSP